MRSRRLLTLSLDDAPIWVRLYIHQIGDRWAAILLAEGVPSPEPDTLKGLAFFETTPDEATRVAKAYLGSSESKN